MSKQLYITDKYLSQLLDVSRQTVWRWVREGNLPQPLKLGPNCTRWKMSDIEAWEASRRAVA